MIVAPLVWTTAKFDTNPGIQFNIFSVCAHGWHSVKREYDTILTVRFCIQNHGLGIIHMAQSPKSNGVESFGVGILDVKKRCLTPTTRSKLLYCIPVNEMEVKPYFDVRFLVIHIKITIL